jgi:hypothetical protein
LLEVMVVSTGFMDSLEATSALVELEVAMIAFVELEIAMIAFAELEVAMVALVELEVAIIALQVSVNGVELGKDLYKESARTIASPTLI